jgi:small subunit ribosomal protein S16
MATVIRFARHGTKKKPFFRIVIQDQHAARDGRFIENIGYFSPIKGDTSLNVQRDRLEYWLSVGAKMSDSVRNRVRLLMKQWQTAAPGTQASGTVPPAVVEEKKPKRKAARGKEA